MAKLVVADEPQTKYRGFIGAGAITIARRPAIRRPDRVFTIGSCFAREVRFALRDLGLQVTPEYRTIAFDPSTARVDNLPDEEHLNFYNAFTILQEIQRAAGRWKPAGDDVWSVRSKEWGGSPCFQDPYRRLVFGRTREALAAVSGEVDRVVREAFLSANAFLITYGMTEVFRNKASGKVVAQRPLYGGGGGVGETEFWRSGFDDNLAAIRETVRLITAQNANARIFLTVSPVALERTFSRDDIFVANSESKAILRAAIGQVSREFCAVTYFPAYEAVMSDGLAGFRADGRHVLPDVVSSIMRTFVEAHVDLGGEEPATWDRREGSTGEAAEPRAVQPARNDTDKRPRLDLPRRLRKWLRQVMPLARSP